MRFSVFTASTPEWTPEEVVGILAGQGWDGVEWRITDQRSDGTGFWSGNKATWPLTGLEQDVPRIRRLTADAGLELSAVGGYVPPTDQPNAERMLAATAALGATQVRIAGLGTGGAPYTEAFARCRELWSWVADRARAHGVRALIELHHETLTPSAFAARRLLDGLDPAHVGVIHDIGNLVIEGWEEPRNGLDLLGEYLAHVHVKNCAFFRTDDGWKPEWVPLDAGRADLRKYFEDLAAIGYDGWVTVEDFSTEVPLRERTAGNLAYLRAAATAAGYDLR